MYYGIVVLPLVSVILPTRDRPALLLRAAASVLQQRNVEIELVVVDNNTLMAPLNVNTAAFISDSRVRLVRAADAKNAASARNAGLAAARGHWITYLDDDDVYNADKIAIQLALAEATGAPFVLCGAVVHLRGRTRRVQCESKLYSGDSLLYSARLGTPLMLHRRVDELRFDDELFAGEDACFGHALLAHWALQSVPVVPEPLMEIYQDGPDRPRTNLQVQANWRAARRLWWRFGARYSRKARRIFVLRALIAREKMLRRPGRCLAFSYRLLRTGGMGQARFVANAILLASGFARGRLVT